MQNPFIEDSYRDFTRHFRIVGTFVHLEQLDEQRRDALVALEVNKHHVKVLLSLLETPLGCSSRMPGNLKCFFLGFSDMDQVR